MNQRTALRVEDIEKREQRWATALSIAIHLAILAICIFIFRHPLSTQIIAAGEGEGGNQGSAIEVGVIAASQLGFTKPRPVSYVGETKEETNTTVVETKRPEPPRKAEVLPRNEKKPLKAAEKPITTERPTTNQTEQIFSRKPSSGSSTNTNVEVGRSYGSPTPSLSGGIGIGMSSTGGAGTGGVPGGSEYGRRIQMILSRNYNPPQIAQASQTHFVIIQLRISRDGQIVSLASGRIASRYIKQASPFDLVNRAAERAILASNPLPPFPNGFLIGVQEAVAEIWFRYPK